MLMASRAFQKSTGGDADDDAAVEEAAEQAIVSLLLMTPSASTAACTQNGNGATLLHVAVCADVHERVLARLLALAPRSAKVPDRRGFLPLHFAAAFGTAPWQVVEEMIRLHPDSTSIQTDETGDTPLHLLMSNSHKFVCAIPEDAGGDDGGKKKKKKRKKKKDGDSYAVDENTIKLAELLLSTSENAKLPAPILIRNHEDLNPLHAAALFNTPVQLTRILMESSGGAQAVAQTTSYGGDRTALHLACASRKVSKCAGNVEVLSSREACAAVDEQGKTPLAVAAQNRKVTKKVVKTLTSTYPEAASVPTPTKGYLPIHLAVRNTKSKPTVIKALLNACPDAVRAVTNKGNTPLHEACKYGAPRPVVELLIDEYPGALSVENKSHELPIDRARANGATRDTITLLDGSLFVYQRMEREKSGDSAKSDPSPSGYEV